LLTSAIGFLLVATSDHTTRSRNIKLEVVFKVQKIALYASFSLIMGPFKGNCLFLPDYRLFGRIGDVRREAVSLTWARQYSVRVRVSFTTGAVRSAILATAGLLVTKRLGNVSATCNVSVSSRTQFPTSRSRTFRSQVLSRSWPKRSRAHPCLLGKYI